MLKEAIEKIVSLATPETYVVDGKTYTTADLAIVEPPILRPERISFSSLDAIVQAVLAEIGRNEVAKPLFVNVASHKQVSVFTTLRTDNLKRDTLYIAEPDLPRAFDTWSGHDDMIIALRSQFIPNDDVDYILDLLKRISKDDGVSSEDNGVSQKVTATMGVALKDNVSVKPRVRLAPYRTFLEVAQPESEFILRLKNVEGDAPKVGIIEADGGAWKLEAKKNIADYFRDRLEGLVNNSSVIIAE